MFSSEQKKPKNKRICCQYIYPERKAKGGFSDTNKETWNIRNEERTIKRKVF